MDKQQAIATGSRTYSSNKPCKKHGHVGLRYVCNNSCVQCRQTPDAKNKRDLWRSANLEHKRATDKEYAQRNAKKISEYHKNRYQTVLRSTRLQQYTDWKQAQADAIRTMFLDLELPTTNGSYVTEQQFKNYMIHLIVKTTGLTVIPEYSPTNKRSRGAIDMFIPELNLGIETKLNAPYWTPKLIHTQQRKYEQWLGEGNVIVTSPSGEIGITPEAVIEIVKTRHATLLESQVHELSST